MRVAWMLRGWDSLRHGCSGMGCAVTSHVGLDDVGNGIPSSIMRLLYGSMVRAWHECCLNQEAVMPSGNSCVTHARSKRT